MRDKKYLLDTHACYQWAVKESVSTNFIDFFNKQSVDGKNVPGEISSSCQA